MAFFGCLSVVLCFLFFLPSSLFPFVFLVLLFCALRPAFFLVGLWFGVFVACAFCLRAGLLSCSFFTVFLVLLFDCFFSFGSSLFFLFCMVIHDTRILIDHFLTSHLCMYTIAYAVFHLLSCEKRWLFGKTYISHLFVLYAQ